MKTTSNTPRHPIASKRSNTSGRGGFNIMRSILLTLIALVTATGTFAQSVVIRSQPLRFTVPKGVAYSNATILTVITSGNPTPTNHLEITGIPGSGNANAWLSQTEITSNATTTVTLSYTNDSTITAGTYDLAVVASGDSNYRLPVPIQVAYVWSGSDYTNLVSTNWSSGGNWLGGVPPSSSDLVVFKDIGGVLNNVATNVIVTSDVTVGSIRFSPEVAATRFNTVEIQSGKKLSVTGGGLSFSMHRDSKTTAAQMETRFVGGGTLEVANPTAEIGVLVDQQQNTTLDMRNLDNFVADVSRIGLGNHRIWPNVYTNGYTGEGTSAAANMPFRFVPLVWLAKTNVIKCSWVDPNNYNNTNLRDYAIEVGNDTAAGTTANIRFTLGLSNAFYIDSICWGHAGKGGGGNNFNFNAANSYAFFRGIGGGRITAWAQGDASGVALSGSNVRGTTVDFSNGQVDALVDRLYLARNRNNSSGFTVQGTLTVGGVYLGSVFDVNNAYLGSQDVINTNAGAVANVANSPIGTVNVNSNATFRVNENLYLAYTTAGSTGTPNYPESTTGILNINNGGVVMASNIVAGGGTELAARREIVMTAGANLIVTNSIGKNSSTGKASLINMTASSLTLHVDGPTPRVFVKTLTLNGLANIINIASVANVGANYPIRFPLVSYETLSGSFGIGTLPSGLYGQLDVDTGNQTIDLIISTNPPNKLVWGGYASSSWNHTDLNWATSPGGIITNFSNGDLVRFDDTCTNSTTISVDATVLISGMTVSNVVKNYEFGGAGNISGSGQLLKQAAADLTLNGISSVGTLVSGGRLLGTGTINSSVTMQNGTTFIFGGTIGGGLTLSNSAALLQSGGSVSGPVALQAGGFTNLGTVTATMSVSSGTLISNASVMNITTPWTVPTNSVLVNNGSITHFPPSPGAFGLTVNGILRGNGSFALGTGFGDSNRVSIASGGQLILGNTANELVSVLFDTRLDLLPGSVTTIDVNSATTNDTIVIGSAGKLNWGDNNSGGTVLINNLGSPFNLASSVQVAAFPSVNFPDNAVPKRPAITPSPGTTISWNLANVVTNGILTVQGLPTLTNSVSTNGITLSWPTNFLDWKVQAQTNTLGVGISTNWATVFSPVGTNGFLQPDTNVSFFHYTFTQPINPTNPAVFYRLTTP